MKRLTLFFISLMCVAGAMADQSVNAPASEVTIFLNGAQVTRQKTVKLAQGKQTITFTGLSSYLRENSIQVGIDGKVSILGVKREYDYAEQEQQNQEIERLKTAISAKEKEIATIKAEQEVIAAEEAFLDANKVLSGKNEAVSLQALQQTINYYRERLTTLKNRSYELAQNLKTKNSELSALKSELNQTQGRATKETSKIIVEVSAQQAGSYPFSLSYYVTQVSWTAAYDLRANSISQPISLTYKAKIYQNTGENWNNVSLTLSSSNPTQNNNKPSLGTYKLTEPDRYEIAYEEEAVATDRVMMAAAPMMAKSVSYGARQNTIETETFENMTSFEIKIKEKYTVKSSGEQTTVDVGVYDLPTKYEYHAVPKKDKDAFLVAQATDWTKHHLINGSANIYFENTYIGQTHINTKSTNDTLTISLGRDKSIVVSREELTDYNKKKFLSSKTEVTKAWEIKVKNQKRQDIDIIVFDQVPVSAHSSIEVSSELSGGELKANTGEVKWRLHIPANGEAKKTLTYKVKYPKDWDLDIE